MKCEIIDRIKGRMGYLFYTRVYTPLKALQIRRKKCINVIFVVTELGLWKTELLYLAMLRHPRFNPVLRVLPSTENEDAKDEVIDYLENKCYPYVFVPKEVPLQKDFKADIIIYQKPYKWVVFPKHQFVHNKNALFCYATYGIHNIVGNPFICNQPLFNYAWQYYFENSQSAEDHALDMDNKGRNILVTGVPIMDALLLPPSNLEVWKPQPTLKKRIIWAPHFSFGADSILGYSTFMKYYDFMLVMAQKYCDCVQFAFKPHPLLRTYLNKEWGKDRTDAYFLRWRNCPNTQVETGQYLDLFKTSDAMIHDCSSFTCEYTYMQKPVMYLLKGKDDRHRDTVNRMTQRAFDLHYKGFEETDIERFIVQVIEGRDEMALERKQFFEHHLLPPGGKSACENIIEAILGNKN